MPGRTRRSRAWARTSQPIDALGSTFGQTLVADPLFVDPASGDYHLQAGSPCVDAGFWSADAPTMDMDGESRPAAGVDIGPDEVH